MSLSGTKATILKMRISGQQRRLHGRSIILFLILRKYLLYKNYQTYADKVEKKQSEGEWLEIRV